MKFFVRNPSSVFTWICFIFLLVFVMLSTTAPIDIFAYWGGQVFSEYPNTLIVESVQQLWAEKTFTHEGEIMNRTRLSDIKSAKSIGKVVHEIG